MPQDAKKDGDLQSALDAMLAVLRCVNDSMHQVAIVGYQVRHRRVRLGQLLIFIKIKLSFLKLFSN